jgi:hypothetical protein
MANGDSNGNGGLWGGMPWWVKAIALVGVPSLISIGVITSDRVQLSGEVRANGDKLNRIETGAVTHDSRVWLRFDELTEASKETNRILLAGCVNDAKTMEARERCIGR